MFLQEYSVGGRYLLEVVDHGRGGAHGDLDAGLALIADHLPLLVPLKVVPHLAPHLFPSVLALGRRHGVVLIKDEKLITETETPKISDFFQVCPFFHFLQKENLYRNVCLDFLVSNANLYSDERI